MPLYEYHCSKCGKIFEVIQKFSDAALTVHEECGGQVERLISTSALQFKGSGWYVTDYAKAQSSSKSEGKEPDAKTSESKPAESKSDGKGSGGETKTEPKPATTTSSTKNEP
jgi:putative FmdB family regulatory protein